MSDRRPSSSTPHHEEEARPVPGTRRDPERARKLAEALRANLRRRKEQARARKAEGKDREPNPR